MTRHSLLVGTLVTAAALVLAQGDPAAQPPAGQGPVMAQPGAVQAPVCGVELPQTMAQPAPIVGSQPPAALGPGPVRGQPAPAQPGGVVVAQPSPTALRTPTELKAHDMIGAIGATVPLKATLKLKTDGRPVPNHTIRFRVSGTSVGADKTNGQGTAQVDYKVPNQFGARKLEVEFAGTLVCAAAKDEETLGVVKSATKMTLALLNPNLPIREGSTVHVNGKIVRITDQGGLDGREIPSRWTARRPPASPPRRAADSRSATRCRRATASRPARSRPRSRATRSTCRPRGSSTSA